MINIGALSVDTATSSNVVSTSIILVDVWVDRQHLTNDSFNWERKIQISFITML